MEERESTLIISKLQSTHLSSIYKDVSLYLSAFSEFIDKPNEKSKSTSSKGNASTDISTLANKFSSFLRQALDLIPKRLLKNPKIDDGYASELFKSYKLCIKCAESILSVAPFKPQECRLQLIVCYANWKYYDDALKEGLCVLESDGSNESNSPQVALDTALMLYDCISGDQIKTTETYESLLHVFEKMGPWIGALDEDAKTTMQGKLVKYLEDCSMSMIRQPSIDQTLTRRFYELTFKELSKISISDQIEKVLHPVDVLTFILHDMEQKTEIDGDDGRKLVRFRLAVCYCLRALPNQYGVPDSKDSVQDIGAALKLWSAQEDFQSGEQAQDTLTLLYHVIDFLSLKGHTEHHMDVYNIMIKIFTDKDRHLQDCLNLLWKSRSITHALCPAHVHDSFIETFSNHHGSSNSMENWISHMEGSEVGFRQTFSLISTVTSPETLKDTHDTQLNSSIDEVKQKASNILASDPNSRKSMFQAAYLYHDLSERMIAQGLMIEALNNAKEATILSSTLFKETFDYTIEQQNNTKRIKTLHIKPLVASSTWLKDIKSSCEIGDYIITPWKILEVYLESILQEGTLRDLFGDYTQAKYLFNRGQKIASFLELPTFRVAFSCAIGNLYRKEQLWDRAQAELDSAKDVLTESYPSNSCIQCKLLLDATIDQQRGDLFRNRISSEVEVGLSKADGYYSSAIESLQVDTWKNDVSNCNEQKSASKNILCQALLIGETQDKSDLRATRSGKRRSESKSAACASDQRKCWHCTPIEIMKSKSLSNIIQMKWECIRRRLLLRLFIGTGKCFEIRGETKKAGDTFLKGVSLLVQRNTFGKSHGTITFTFLRTLIEKNVKGDVFAVEHASVLYNICRFSLSNKGKLVIPITTVISALKQSFIMCREVPVLHRQVSRLLAGLYTLTPSHNIFSRLSSSSDDLSENHWAAYFHQASLGNQYNQQLFSCAGKNSMHNDGTASLNLHKEVAPDSILDLKEFVRKFYNGLPNTTIICISMLRDDWLRDISPDDPPHAWILLSRLNSTRTPIATLLPIKSVLEGKGNSSVKDNEYSSSLFSFSTDPWFCPWGHTIIDDIAPMFRKILQENHASTTMKALELNESSQSIWHGRRKKVDDLLRDFLRNLEKSWFGSLKVLLLGEIFNEGQKKHGNVTSKLRLKKGCHVGGIKSLDRDDSSSPFSQLILEAINEIGDNVSIDREPVILVPDFDIQMLPWESLPILRKQEVYRMPSVAAISLTFDRCRKDSGTFPMIDPQDSYYLLDPEDNLPGFKKKYRPFFEKLHIEGTTGRQLTVDELRTILKERDLYMYFGHGSGQQFVRGREIRELGGCAAALLVGCSSGALYLKGSYTPNGAPLDYLCAGSPLVVANLWEVTVGEMNMFGDALLLKWIEKRPGSLEECTLCVESSIESSQVDSHRISCKHRPKIGAFMGQARDACGLPYIAGAAPVCYGVPTVIRNKKL